MHIFWCDFTFFSHCLKFIYKAYCSNKKKLGKRVTYQDKSSKRCPTRSGTSSRWPCLYLARHSAERCPKILLPSNEIFGWPKNLPRCCQGATKLLGLRSSGWTNPVSCILHILHTTYICFRPTFYVTRLRIENYTSGDDVKPGKYFINSFQKLVSRHKYIVANE